MADQTKRDAQAGQDNTPTTGKQSQSGDPGRTPGKAEGDEKTVNESLREKENKPLH